MTDSSRIPRLIHSFIERMTDDSAMRARLRRAASAELEYLSWEYLVPFGISLHNDHERRAYVLVASVLATEKPASDGEWSLIRCLLEIEQQKKRGADNPASAERRGDKDEQKEVRTKGPVVARFRRLLACTDQEELCRIVRPVLQLVVSRVPGRLSYERLLRDILYFGPRVKERWAQEFYSWQPEEEKQA